MVKRLLDTQKIIGTKKSAFIFGARGTGKTTLSEEFMGHQKASFSLNLLNQDIFGRYLRNPSLLRKEILSLLKSSSKPLTVFIDEIQKIPQLLDEVHDLIVHHKNEVRFLLSGSSSRKLKRNGANLLAGRAWTLNLHPLTHLECEWDLERVLQIGSLPGIYFEEEGPERSLRAYVGTYLKEEIQAEALVRNLQGFSRFLEVAAQMNAEPTNFTQIGRQAGVSTKTIQEYYSILEDTYLVHRLDGWTQSVRKQLQGAPKFYLFDCGVLNAIRGDLGGELKESSLRFGKLFETMVLQEIFRLNDYYELDLKFHYWRTSAGLEVDLVLSKGSYRSPIGIEIKSSEAPDKAALHGLVSFAADHPKARRVVLCRSPKKYELDGIEVLPWQEGISAILGIE